MATTKHVSFIIAFLFTFYTEIFAGSTLNELLPGTWYVQKMELMSTRLLTRQQLRKFTATKRKLEKTNNQITSGTVIIRVDFKTDSSYNYKMTENHRVFYFERGNWRYQDSVMQAFNLTHETDRSSFNNEKTITLTPDTWIVEFTVLGNNSGIKQRIIYKKKSN
ncbi:MAG: hypothetical protein U0Y96_11910 [Candidatus Kapaibacterium sp.]